MCLCEKEGANGKVNAVCYTGNRSSLALLAGKKGRSVEKGKKDANKRVKELRNTLRGDSGRQERNHNCY